MRFLNRTLGLLFLMGIVLWPLTIEAQSQGVSVQAEISSKTVALGSTVTFIIRINGTQNASPIKFPDIDGIEDRYLGPSRQVSIVNGQYASSIAFSYSLLPLQVGSFVIPAFEVMVNGQSYKTQSVTLEVSDSNKVLNNQNTSKTVSLKDKIFLRLQIPKDKIYLNERLPIKIYLYVSDLTVRDIQFPELENVGIIVGDFPKPIRMQKIIEGMRYEILEFNTSIYPTRTGVIKLGPAQVDCNIVVSSNSPLKNRRGMFNDDFFDSFFRREERRGVNLQSGKVKLEVIDLPQSGKPVNFSGGVGDFNFDVSLSPTDLKVGDPITLKMSISGKNSEILQSVKFPKFSDQDNFKLYDPIIREVNGVKSLEQVIIPVYDTVKEIPEFEFSYFNINLGKYRSIKKGPFSINVEKLQESEGFTIVGGDSQISYFTPEKLGEDIVYIKDSPGKIQKIDDRLYKNVLFYLLIVIAAGLWLTTYILYKRTLKLQTDIRYAKKIRAPRKAKEGLREAKLLISQNKKEEFYDKLYKTFEYYLAHSLGLSSGAVNIEVIKEKLADHSKADGIIKDIEQIFQECEMVRYASQGIDESKMLDSYQKVEKTIDFIERYIK